MKKSERQHWEKFWTEKKDPSEIYDNSGRILIGLNRVLESFENKNVLEVGAGTARDSFMLAERGANVFVLDYADAALDLIRVQNQTATAKVIPVQGDAFALPFEDNSMDIVFHQGLLEHFQNPWGIVSENFRVLKPNGLIVVDVPQKYHIYTLIKHGLIAADMWFAGWETEFTLSEMSKKLTSIGFEVVDYYGFWMYPSLFYRMTREAIWRTGFRLPLKPPEIPGITQIRKFTRDKLRHTKFCANTSLAIGVIGRKIEPKVM